MRYRSTSTLLAILFVIFAGVSALAAPPLAPYAQNFESLVPTNIAALTTDGWLVFGNVYSPDGVTYYYGYGPFDAPNTGFGFCQLATAQGGLDQGDVQLAVFSDYNNNAAHADSNLVESNTYREYEITADNVGETWNFSFQAKRGNIEKFSTASAFIKTLDPLSGYATTNYVSEDMTNIPDTWGGWTLSLSIADSLVGQLFQIGFANQATRFQGSAIYYDNLVLEIDPGTGAPPASRSATLAQNTPNPFNPSTSIAFTLAHEGRVRLSIYDVAGRRVADLVDQVYTAGDHSVIWNGRSNDGQPVASGQYRYVLSTERGTIARGMTLLK